MKRHFLKCLNPFFTDIWEGRKTFEIRFNDRDYKVEDELILEELETGGNTGRVIYANVPYLLDERPYLTENYVCMSLEVTNKKDISQIVLTSKNQSCDYCNKPLLLREYNCNNGLCYECSHNQDEPY